MVTTVNIHEAKTHLSRLVARAARGEEVVIAKAGKPLVRLVPIEPVSSQRRLGFLADAARMPADIKAAFGADIEATFNR